MKARPSYLRWTSADTRIKICARVAGYLVVESLTRYGGRRQKSLNSAKTCAKTSDDNPPKASVDYLDNTLRSTIK